MSHAVRRIPDDERKKQRKCDHSRDIRIFSLQPPPFSCGRGADKNPKSEPQDTNLVEQTKPQKKPQMHPVFFIAGFYKKNENVCRPGPEEQVERVHRKETIHGEINERNNGSE